jgi:hypothetical protein
MGKDLNFADALHLAVCGSAVMHIFDGFPSKVGYIKGLTSDCPGLSW